MKNIEKAINFETILLACHCSESKAVEMYNHLEDWCDMGASIGDNLEAYRFLTGCSESDLYKAQVAVVKAFENLPQDTQIICDGDSEWNNDVKDCKFLYVRGNVSLLKKKGISIVGTRQVSAQGIEKTKKVVDALGKDYVIVSGLAKGIDGAGHIEALSSGFDTVAVIGTPLNTVYPQEHEQLQELIAKNGLVVSQFGPSRRVQQYFFIQRNLTMSQISKGSFVIESSDTGGAVRQAKYSAKQEKPVFVFRDLYEDKSLKWLKEFEKIVVVPTENDISEYVNNFSKYEKQTGQNRLF